MRWHNSTIIIVVSLISFRPIDLSSIIPACMNLLPLVPFSVHLTPTGQHRSFVHEGRQNSPLPLRVSLGLTFTSTVYGNAYFYSYHPGSSLVCLCNRQHKFHVYIHSSVGLQLLLVCLSSPNITTFPSSTISVSLLFTTSIFLFIPLGYRHTLSSPSISCSLE